MSTRGRFDAPLPPEGSQPPLAHPIDPFLDAWFGDEARGYDDQLRVYRALSLPGPWDLLRLKRVLQALLARTPEAVPRFNRCFEAFFPAGAVPEWLQARLNDPEQFSQARALAELAAALERQPQGPPASPKGEHGPKSPKGEHSPKSPEGEHSPKSPEGPKPPSAPETSPVTPEAGPSAWLKGRPYGWAVVLLGGLGLLLLLLLALSRNLSEPESTPTPAPISGTAQPAGEERVTRLPESTQVSLAMPKLELLAEPWMGGGAVLMGWLGLGWLGLGLGLLLLLLAGGLWRRGTRRPLAPPLDPEGTGEWTLPEPVEALPLYESSWLHRLAYQVGSHAEQELMELDARATVRETLRRGGLLELRLRPVRMPSTLRLVVPLDWRVEPVAYQALRELKEGIVARGVRLEWCEYASGRMPKPSVGGVTLFFLRGEQRLPDDIPWGLPFSAFVDLREPGLWGPELERLPRRLYSLLPSDLLEALQEASSDLHLTEPRHPVRVLSSLERLEEARVLAGMAALASLYGPTSLRALEELRQQLLPGSSPFWWQRVLQLRFPVEDEQGGIITGQLQLESGHIVCEPGVAKRLVSDLNASWQLKVLHWQRQRLEQQRPPERTPAWLNHQYRLDALTVNALFLEGEQRVPPQLTGPEQEALDAALLRLAASAFSPFVEQARGALRGSGVVGGAWGCWKATGKASARERSLLAASGLAGVPTAGGRLSLSRRQAQVVGGLGLLGLLLSVGGGGMVGLEPPPEPTPEPTLTLEVRGAVAFALARRVVQSFFCPGCGGGDSITWISIPGTGPDGFWMGSKDGVGEDDERPRHQVVVQPFQLSKTEVTVAQYQACVDAGKCTEPQTGTYCNWKVKGREQHPINCVDWNQAKAYAAWLSTVVGGTVRLPTEAEWEYAARGKEERQYPWGDSPKPSCDVAVLNPSGLTDSTKWGCGKGSTWPVCSKEKGNTPNGLCDMAGNVWEWVEDCYHSNYTGAPEDGTAWIKDCSRSDSHIIRGAPGTVSPSGCAGRTGPGTRPGAGAGTWGSAWFWCLCPAGNIDTRSFEYRGPGQQ